MQTPTFDSLRFRPSGRAVMRQRWLSLTFLHWRIRSADLQAKLPLGLEVDEHEGQAYLGLVAFTMQGIRVPPLPAIPVLSTFHEWNVRTYVRSPHGPGVWFFSLDASQSSAVLAARATYKLPYHRSKMALSVDEHGVEYLAKRYWPRPQADAARLVVSTLGRPEAAKPDTLEYWLVERYLLYAASRGRLYSGRVHHAPYEVAQATVIDLGVKSLVHAPGFSDLGTPIDTVLYSPGVDVEVFPLKRVLRDRR